MAFEMFDADVARTTIRQVDPHLLVPPSEEATTALYDEVAATLVGDFPEALKQANLDRLFRALNQRKFASTPAAWSAWIEESRRHPLRELVHQDPFTYRAFSKPRGYAGDAVMMDYIYGREEHWTPPECTAVGRSVFQFTTGAPASEGVRARRAYIATRIDRLVEERRHPHILAVAAGHMREAGMSSAVRRRKTGRYIALDADAESLQEVQRSYGIYGVETVTASFRRLLTNPGGVGEFDFVYSTGLFDYLNQRAGRRLVSGMFQMLRPGGRMIVANFLSGVRDIGYMETFMDWQLIYRTRRDMVDLTMDIPEDDIAEVRIVSEECRNIVFLEVRRV
ncbi:MAG: class I SAM-dependent methyltransferase [Pirellulales bacterium]